MTNNITLSPVLTDEDSRFYREQIRAYMLRDILPETDDALGAPNTDEDRAFFLSPEREALLDAVCQRETDRAERFLFVKDGVRIGLCMVCTSLSEDGKCFVIDFCILPEHRCQGLGKACFAALSAHETARGAAYFELNTHRLRAMRFWQSLGFLYNGYDAHGSILLIRPPAGDVPIVCSAPDTDDMEQIFDLENGYKAEIGEPFLSAAQQDALQAAVSAGRIRFFCAKRATRVIGMCSVVPMFSTFACAQTALFEDFFISPAFRRRGVARQLAAHVQTVLAKEGYASLLVGASAPDEVMYASLGFDEPIGKLMACPLSQKEARA